MRFYVTCNQHVTLSALFPCTSRKLIIFNSKPICKENFYDRAGVLRTANGMVLRGDVLCPHCHGPLTVHGSYTRHLRDEFRQRHDGWIVQVHCSACNTYPSLTPDFIMPYKHYMAEVIEAAIIESEEGCLSLSSCPADDSTMRRWVNQFNEHGARAAGWLLALLFEVCGCLVGTLQQQNMGLLKRLDYLTQQFSVPKTGGIIGRVNIVITRYDRGFL